MSSIQGLVSLPPPSNGARDGALASSEERHLVAIKPLENVSEDRSSSASQAGNHGDHGDHGADVLQPVPIDKLLEGEETPQDSARMVLERIIASSSNATEPWWGPLPLRSDQAYRYASWPMQLSLCSIGADLCLLPLLPPCVLSFSRLVSITNAESVEEVLHKNYVVEHVGLVPGVNYSQQGDLDLYSKVRPVTGSTACSHFVTMPLLCMFRFPLVIAGRIEAAGAAATKPRYSCLH